MILTQLSMLALSLATGTFAHTPGSFEDGGNTLVSAMMMFLGTNEIVYMLDKAEGNAAQIDGHPASGSWYNIAERSSTVMPITTNAFCSSGMHLPNGSYATFGGNGGVGPGGAIDNSTVTEAGGYTGLYDKTYGDWDGTKAIRVLNVCPPDQMDQPQCQWFDNASLLSMHGQRWYSAAEALGNGTVAIIGGYTSGGYINRNTPNIDPAYEGGAANPTYEFYPSTGPAQLMQFMVKTSGLNSYAHTFLMPSGKLFLQANTSTMLWEPDTNTETELPEMPDQIIRVYPASGATAMLPLTPENNWTPSVIFCGGSDMPESAWGNYSWPFIDTFYYPASARCHKITPEPTDGSQPAYVEDDPMPVGRTMGQFIALPDLTMLVVNGGENGTAGYSERTLTTPLYGDMPYGMSLAAGPVGQPAVYNPKAPAGSRWSTAGFSTSDIARLYHSSAMLLPDASVLIAGSNPNVDVNLTTYFPTQYKAEVFYPSYFSAATRPQPQNVPSTLSYGGSYFNITVPATSYSGDANSAADNTSVVVIRPGWTTHAMNMGQRSLQLNNTYTVNSDGTITLHVSQMPPNPNLFQPGPAFVFVTMSGIPSNGTYVIVGNGQVSAQPVGTASALPPTVRLSNVSGSGSSSTTSSSNPSTQTSGASHTGAIIGGIVGAVALVGILGAGFGIYMSRRKQSSAQQRQVPSYPMSAAPGSGGGAMANRLRNSDSSAFVPLQHDNRSVPWDAGNASSVALSPYQDDVRGGTSAEFDPYYQNTPRMSTNQARSPF
ncbi:DUF1929-domain-containing protein [Amylocystis lapponica]|nr:DUF1929-domain-containing protein [Amylocystis lapponica]